MDIAEAVKLMLTAQAQLRSDEGILNQSFMSEWMMRLSAYTSAVEEKLGKYEEWIELEEARLYKGYMVDRDVKMTAAAAEKLVKVFTADDRAKIKYLSRIVAASWRLVSSVQSRWNHLSQQKAGQI